MRFLLEYTETVGFISGHKWVKQTLLKVEDDYMGHVVLTVKKEEISKKK